MRKIYSLFLLLIAFSSAINAQFTLLEGSGTVKNMSSNGKYVLGTSKFFQIAENGTVESITGSSYANAVSNDGIIYGTNTSSEYTATYFDYDPDTGEEVDYGTDNIRTGAYMLYGEGNSWTTLPFSLGKNLRVQGDLIKSYYGDIPYATTDDGIIVVGGFLPESLAGRKQAAYWEFTADGVKQVTLIPNTLGVGSMIYGVSGDGKVMGGYYGGSTEEKSFGGSRIAIVWIDGELTTIPGIPNYTYISAVSNNGRYATLNEDYGSMDYNTIDPRRAGVCDIEAKTYKWLNTNENLVSVACDVSDNGVVVGYQGSGNNRRAYIYITSRGMMDLAEFLQEVGITYPEGFIFYEVNAISADGHIIAGTGNNGGFYIEIPDIPQGAYPVEDIQVEALSYGTVTISWETPATTDKANLTGYAIYRDGTKINEAAATATSYEDTVEDGTYTYYIQALYDNGYETERSGSKTVTMGKLSLPYFDTFDGYRVGSAQSLRDRRYWDVTTNTTDDWHIWQVSESGNPPNCLEFKVPGAGDYEETITSAFFDASNLSSLYLNFVVAYTTSGPGHNVAVEVYDGEEWQEVDVLNDGFKWSVFEARRYNITDIAAGKNNVRIRFRAFGTGNGFNDQWDFDNLEIAGDDDVLTHPSPLAINVTEGENGVVFINWVSPEETARLKYADTYGWTASMIGNEGEPFIAANMYPAEEMAIYNDYYITELAFMPSKVTLYDDEGEEIKLESPTFKWYVAQGDERIYDADIIGANANEVNNGLFTTFDWFIDKLESPIKIDGNKSLYFGVEVVSHDVNDMPIATSDIYHVDIIYQGDQPLALNVSHNVADGRANIYSEDNGETWKTLDFYFDNEFNGDRVYPLINVYATLEKTPGASSTLDHLTNYKVLRNGTNIINERFLDNNNHTINTTIVDYDRTPGEEICYEVKAHYITLVDSEPATECITIDITNIDSYEKDHAGISVYPSPVAKGQSLNVDLGTDVIEGSVKIYTTAGNLIKEVLVTDRITNVGIDFPAGIYFININGKVVKIAVE